MITFEMCHSCGQGSFGIEYFQHFNHFLHFKRNDKNIINSVNKLRKMADKKESIDILLKKVEKERENKKEENKLSTSCTLPVSPTILVSTLHFIALYSDANTTYQRFV